MLINQKGILFFEVDPPETLNLNDREKEYAKENCDKYSEASSDLELDHWLEFSSTDGEEKENYPPAEDITFNKPSTNYDGRKSGEILSFKNIPTFAGGYFKKPFDHEEKRPVNQNITKSEIMNKIKTNPVPKNQSFLPSFFISESKKI